MKITPTTLLQDLEGMFTKEELQFYLMLYSLGTSRTFGSQTIWFSDPIENPLSEWLSDENNLTSLLNYLTSKRTVVVTTNMDNNIWSDYTIEFKDNLSLEKEFQRLCADEFLASQQRELALMAHYRKSLSKELLRAQEKRDKLLMAPTPSLFNRKAYLEHKTKLKTLQERVNFFEDKLYEVRAEEQAMTDYEVLSISSIPPELQKVRHLYRPFLLEHGYELAKTEVSDSCLVEVWETSLDPNNKSNSLHSEDS